MWVVYYTAINIHYNQYKSSFNTETMVRRYDIRMMRHIGFALSPILGIIILRLFFPFPFLL